MQAETCRGDDLLQSWCRDGVFVAGLRRDARNLDAEPAIDGLASMTNWTEVMHFLSPQFHTQPPPSRMTVVGSSVVTLRTRISPVAGGRISQAPAREMDLEGKAFNGALAHVRPNRFHL